jgi:uncharacterized protein YqeY
MSLKERIQADFLTSMKEKDETKKSTLKMLKTKITEAEKASANESLSDDAVIKTIITSVKQRRQSIEEFSKANRLDLVQKEKAELEILESYLPKQMTEEEISEELRKIMQASFTPDSTLDEKALFRVRMTVKGQSIGKFNKTFTGRAHV